MVLTGQGIGRQEVEEEEVFGASKKTARSPEVEKKICRKMEQILEKLEEMKVEKKGNKGDATREPRSRERNRTTNGRI
jgi:hypothetical protein